MELLTRPCRVIVMGPIYADTIFTGLSRLPKPGEEIVAEEVGWAPGGYAISALACHRLGAETTLVGEIGDDFYGDALMNAFEEAQLDTHGIFRATGGHTNIAVTLNWNGDRGIVSYGRVPRAPWSWFEGILNEAKAGTTVLLSARHALAPQVAQYCRRADFTLALSLSWHPEFLTSWALRDLLPSADMLFCNVPEALLVTGETTVERAGRRLAESVREVIVTRGPEGADLLCEGRHIRGPAIPVAVVDATGAGDVFASTYIVARGWGWEHTAALTAANVCAGRSVGTVGGGTAFPAAAELLDATKELLHE